LTWFISIMFDPAVAANAVGTPLPWGEVGA